MDGIARHDGGGCAGGVDNRRNRDTHSREATMIQRGGRPVAGFGGVPKPSFGLGDAALPSGDAALHLMQGKRGALVEVCATTLLRSALAATGLAVAGFRGKTLLKATAGAVLGIEAGVLVWAWKNRKSA
jgi:hypothetical protein